MTSPSGYPRRMPDGTVFYDATTFVRQGPNGEPVAAGWYSFDADHDERYLAERALALFGADWTIDDATVRDQHGRCTASVKRAE